MTQMKHHPVTDASSHLSTRTHSRGLHTPAPPLPDSPDPPFFTWQAITISPTPVQSHQGKQEDQPQAPGQLHKPYPLEYAPNAQPAARGRPVHEPSSASRPLVSHGSTDAPHRVSSEPAEDDQEQKPAAEHATVTCSTQGHLLSLHWQTPYGCDFLTRESLVG